MGENFGFWFWWCPFCWGTSTLTSHHQTHYLVEDHPSQEGLYCIWWKYKVEALCSDQVLASQHLNHQQQVVDMECLDHPLHHQHQVFELQMQPQFLSENWTVRHSCSRQVLQYLDLLPPSGASLLEGPLWWFRGPCAAAPKSTYGP